MPDRATHTAVGIAAGVLTALARAPAGDCGIPMPEALGGVAGGYLGGRLPDILEPATSPRHRALAHSGVLAAILAASFDGLREWERYCWTRAESHRALRCVDPGYASWHALAEWFWRLLAAVAAGLLAGYLSHLALDFLTPRSLPLLAR